MELFTVVGCRQLRYPCIQAICLLLAGVTLAGLGGCESLYHRLGGHFAGPPEQLEDAASDHALALIDRAFTDIEPEHFADHHIHLLTTDFHPEWLDPVRFMKFGRARVFLSAARVSHRSLTIEQDYLDRLLNLADHFPVPMRMFIYAMDRTYDRHGAVNLEQTPFYISNDYIYARWQEHPDRFVPVASIHPYRHDAVQKLRRWASQGVRFIKWLPNTMNFNPADPKLDPFYEAMAELDMVLLSHTGDEDAVNEWGQHLGNPLLLRRALDHGIKVVALHAASNGRSPDLDHPYRPLVSNLELFMRIMDDPRYDGLLFGEISALTFRNHAKPALYKLLERTDLHHRLINGSDYPFCAVALAISMDQLAGMQVITRAEARALRQIYRYNPLLFDFVLKRTVRHPRTGHRFKACIFHTPEPLR